MHRRKSADQKSWASTCECGINSKCVKVQFLAVRCWRKRDCSSCLFISFASKRNAVYLLWVFWNVSVIKSNRLIQKWIQSIVKWTLKNPWKMLMLPPIMLSIMFHQTFLIFLHKLYLIYLFAFLFFSPICMFFFGILNFLHH